MAKKKLDLRAVRKVRLGEFEGKPVVGARVIVRNTGDGLSNAQAVDPVKLDQGDRVIVAFECDVSEIRFDPYEKDELDGDQLRVHILKAESATILPTGAAYDETLKLLKDQEARINAAVEAAQGQEQLPGTEAKDAEKPKPEKSPNTRKRTRKTVTKKTTRSTRKRPTH